MQRRHDGEGGRRRIARHDDVAALQLGPADDGDALAATALEVGHAHLGAEMAQHALGVIARGFRFDHRGLARGVEAGQQDAALHLRRRDRQRVVRSAPSRRCRRCRAACGRRRATRSARPCATAARSRAASAGARSEPSPVMKLTKGWLARMPDSSRAEVPELPRSSTSSGSRPPPTPNPRTRQIGPSCTIRSRRAPAGPPPCTARPRLPAGRKSRFRPAPGRQTSTPDAIRTCLQAPGPGR